jgi:hypothetical protein
MSPFCIVVTVDIIMNVYLLLPLEGPLIGIKYCIVLYCIVEPLSKLAYIFFLLKATQI